MSALKLGNEWQIEPVVLFRIYPQTTKDNTNTSHLVNPKVKRKDSIEIAVLQAKLDAADRMVDELKEDRDQWRHAANRLLESPPATVRTERGFLWSLFGLR